MNYKNLNDNELVYLCSENNEEAFNIIIDKYKIYILNLLKQFKKKYNIIGVEISDLYQEGLVGLLQAINTYNNQKDVLFYTYANACIKKNIINTIKKTFQKKNRYLNNSYSLDNIINDSNSSFYDIFKDESSEPNKVLIDREEEEEIINNLKNKLSKNELTIFELKLNGLNNSEISHLIDKDKKYIENALFRINKKYKELNKEEIFS